MKYNYQKEFFLLRDDSDGTTKLFHNWWNVVDFLTDDIMASGYRIIPDETNTNFNFTWITEWRAPKDRAECFNLLSNMEDLIDLNNLLEDLWHTELIEFSD